MNEFIIYPKRGRMIILAFFALLFVLVGAVFIVVYFGEEGIPLWLPVVGLISVLFFGFCSVY